PPSGGGSTARASGENAKQASAATRKARRSRRLLGKLRMGRMVLLSRSFRAYILNLSFFSRCDRSVSSLEKSEGTTGRKGLLCPIQSVARFTRGLLGCLSGTLPDIRRS